MLAGQPTYHGALSAITASGARAVPVSMTDDGWDLDAMEAAMHQLAPDLVYLIADNRNPTGHTLPAADRKRLAHIVTGTRTRTVVDETISGIWLGQPVPPPPAAELTRRRDLDLTVGSVSKSFWGGLRIGWIRAERSVMPAAMRPSVDMGTAILEQLSAAELLVHTDELPPGRREDPAGAPNPTRGAWRNVTGAVAPETTTVV